MSERRERRLTNEARSVAGRCLGNKYQHEEFRYSSVWIYLHRAQKQLCEAEKSIPVFEVQEIVVEEGV